jgi:excisionase family DNA binding protein
MQHTTATDSMQQPDSSRLPKEFLSTREMADIMGVTYRTAGRWVADGAVPSARIGGTRRIRRSDLEAMFKRGDRAS